MKFYCFIRESSRGQKDRYGPTAQWRDMESFAQSWPGGPHLVSRESCDVIIESATEWERPLWQQAISRAIDHYKAGQVDAFLFGRVDRESRNPFSSVPLMRLALDAGVKVYFAQDMFCLDPKDFESLKKYTDEIQEAMAYISRFKRITKPGRIARARDDQKHPMNTRMFGFNLINGKRVPNQAQAAALREAAQVALREGRPGPAARWLNEKGFRTTHGKQFSPATLGGKGGLFRNRALIGETTINFQEEVVVIHHEAILDMATFEALQDMLNERRLRAPRSDVFYALSGVIFCACGARFEPTKVLNNRYYRCKGYCGERAWRKDEFEFEVNEAFCDYLNDWESQEPQLQLAQQSRAKLERDLAELERELAGNNREWKTLLEKDLAEYPDIILKDKKQQLSAERESLLRAKATIEVGIALIPNVDLADIKRAISELVTKDWWTTNSIVQRKARPKSELEALPQAELADVEQQGSELVATTWWENPSRYKLPYRMSRMGASEMPRRLTEKQAHLLRETLLKLNCRITIKHRDISISGKLPISVKQDTSVSL